MVRIFILLALLLAPLRPWAGVHGRVPNLRLRMGMNMLNFTVGDTFKNQALGEVMCLNPTVLWSFPSFRAQMGLHYMADFGSKFGTTPISGIGLASYFYPFGLSTAYEVGQDDTLIQKSKPGPHVFAMVTPVNFNINAGADQSPTKAPVSFSSFMIETALGAGYDYPATPNRIFSLEIQYRFAQAQEKNTKTTIAYSGLGAMLVFATSYH